MEPETYRGGKRSPNDVILDIVRQPVMLRDIATESYSGAHAFGRLQMGDFVLQLLLETSEFLPRAASYRDFRVAAGAWCSGPGSKYGRVLGHNVKVDDTDIVNIHAEDQVVAKATDAGSDRISVLSVIGPPQQDHVSGKDMETLMPCGRCRHMLRNSDLIDDKTLFVMARPDFTVIQFASLAAIKTVHETNDDSGVTTFKFAATPAILRPRDMPDGWDNNRRPRHIEEINSTDYDDTIGSFLVKRFFESQQRE